MPEVFKSLKDSKLAGALREGQVGVIPTDTVYGIVCLASNQVAVDRLYKTKNRQAKPGTIVAANIEQLTDLGIKRAYLRAVEQFWPGPISVVVPFSDPAGDYLRQGLNDIAVRLPKDTELVNMLSKTGALLTSSANPPGGKPATTLKEAHKYFGDKVDFYVDGGDLSDREASTVVKIIDDAVEVLRQGAVKIENNGVVK